jgi:polysaccharide export outer membrane protein
MKHLLLTSLSLIAALSTISESPALAKLGQTVIAATPNPQPAQAAAINTSEYLLGPGDQITVFVADLPDEFADKTFRVDSAGDVSLPVIGHLHAAGLTTSGLEAATKVKLLHVLKNPEVSIALAGLGSQSVSVLGAVNQPGIRPLEGHKTLFEMLSASGGLRPDAGYLVNVTRDLKWGRIPLPESAIDPSGTCSVANIRLKDIINATNPADNIVIFPGDTISVPRAELVYAVGSVVKPGGFPLNEHESLSALQIVSLAEGLSKTAASDRAKILRTIAGKPQRIEIAVNIKQLMAGKGSDVQLQADDILFIPNSGAKSVGYRAIESIVTAATGVAVYGRY